MKNVNKFNNWLAKKITDSVATMWCAYGFTLLAVISLPAANVLLPYSSRLDL